MLLPTSHTAYSQISHWAEWGACSSTQPATVHIGQRTRHIDRAHKLPPKVVRDKVGGARARGHVRHQALRISGQVLHGRRDRNHLARRRALRQAALTHTAVSERDQCEFVSPHVTHVRHEKHAYARQCPGANKCVQSL